jgi:hypothetical protein
MFPAIRLTSLLKPMPDLPFHRPLEEPTMWQQYRKTFIPLQLLVITVICLLHFHYKETVPTIACAVASMELAAIFGAIWARRLRRRIEAHTPPRPRH